MEQQGRKVKVVKNVTAQMVSAVFQTALGFVVRKFFVIYLTKDLLGLNGLMTSIIGMLSIAELGVGEAINYSLYEPLASGNREKVNAIMRLHKKLYRIIAFVILGLGIVLLPFLQFFVDTNEPTSTVFLIYGLCLLDTFLSYCMSYSRNIVSADQKDYILTNADTLSQIAVGILQIFILILTQNYILYLLVRVAVTFIRNYILHRMSFRLYPYLKSDSVSPLEKDYTDKLKKNIQALSISKLSYFCVSGTDNILLSTFVSLEQVGIYTNYLTIFNLINAVFNTVFNKARSVIGNFIVVNGEDQAYGLFRKIFFVNFMLTGYTSIGIFVLCNDVISLWLGADFLWSPLIVGILVFNNYSRHILQTCEAFRGAVGLYSPRPFVKYLSLFEGVLNLIAFVGLVFVVEDPVLAIFLGTTVSSIVSTALVPWIVYKFLFRRPLREFYFIYVKYFLVGCVALALILLLSSVLVTPFAFLNLLIGGVVCTVVHFAVLTLIFRKTEEYRYFISIVRSFCAKLLKKSGRQS